MDILSIQKRLNQLNFGPILEDGIIGPETEAAIMRFKRKKSLATTPYVGPLTLQALGVSRPTEPVEDMLPWMIEISKHMGEHEVTNNLALRKWLKSDGQTLGDPAKLPWCGDAMETSIKLALPTEPFKGALAINPYWARNWLEFGKESAPKFGSIGVFSRPGGSGHVAYLVGYDPQLGNYRVRGGNQMNRVSDTWIREERLLGIRKPSSWKHELPPLPVMNSRGSIISTNEV